MKPSENFIESGYWSSKRVFVTGVTGLLGPWLVRALLQQGAHVTVLVRDIQAGSIFFRDSLDKCVSVIFGELEDLSLLIRVLNEYDIDTVFHLGAQAIVGIANRSPLSTFKSNIEGTWNLLEACRLCPWVRRIVVASSDKAYGDQPMLPYTEDMPLQGKHPYDVSKSCTDLIALSYYHTYGLPVCVTRCGNFFGGGDLHFNRIIPGTIKALLENRRPIIRSDGTLVRDYIYVKDVVAAYLLVAEKMENIEVVGQAFNFSTDQPLTVLDVVQEVIRLMDRHDLQPFIEGRAHNEIQAQSLCSSKAARLLHWQTTYSFEQALRETIAWYVQNVGMNTLREKHASDATEGAIRVDEWP